MASIRDVAKLAGVSIATVSAVLNDVDCVKESTRIRIQEAIAQLGYTPNYSARELATRRKQNIGFIAMVSDDFDLRWQNFNLGSDMFYFEYFQEIARDFSNTDYGMLYENFNFDPDTENLPRIIAQKRVDSVFVLGGLRSEKFFELLKQHVSNIVALGCITDAVDCVHNDYFRSVYHSVQYLIQHGHRRIAYVNGEKTGAYELKMNGYCQALRDNGIAVDEKLIYDAQYVVSSGYATAQKIISMPREQWPTAICFGDDIIAVGACRYFQECGIRIPEDISVVGYENLMLSEFITPSLTTVDFHKKEIASEACGLMRARLADPSRPVSAVTVPYHLVERRSVCQRD